MTKPKSSLGARVTQRRKELRMSQERLAELVGMTQTGIADIERGGVKRPRKLMELASYLRTSQTWLLTGEGTRDFYEDDAPDTINHDFGNYPATLQPTHNSIESPHTQEFNKIVTVPEIDVLAGAGYGGGFSQEETTSDKFGHSVATDAVRWVWGIPLEFLRSELHVRPDRVHILPVRGDSMNDALYDGDRAIVNLDDVDVSQGGIFALLDDNSSVLIKQVELIRGLEGPRRIKCSSRNSSYAPFELLLEHTKIIGRVASKITRL